MTVSQKITRREEGRDKDRTTPNDFPFLYFTKIVVFLSPNATTTSLTQTCSQPQPETLRSTSPNDKVSLYIAERPSSKEEGASFDLQQYAAASICLGNVTRNERPERRERRSDFCCCCGDFVPRRAKRELVPELVN